MEFLGGRQDLCIKLMHKAMKNAADGESVPVYSAPWAVFLTFQGAIEIEKR